MTNVQFLADLNETLTDSGALGGALPENLRSASDVYSAGEVDALLSGKLNVGGLDSEVAGKPVATAGVDAFVGVDGSGGIVRSYSAFVNVMDYVASSRVEGTTDDTAAFQAAIAAAGAGCGVLIPMGRTIVVDRITISADVYIFSPCGATIKRKSTATPGNWIAITTANFKAQGIVFDGNKAENNNACHNIVVTTGCTSSEFRNCEFKNAKTNSGYGSGLFFNPGHTTAQRHKVINCVSHDNDENGLSAADVYGLSVEGGEYYSNGAGGMYLNNYDLTFAQKILNSRVFGAHVHHNVGTGISVGNFVIDNVISGSTRSYGFTNNEAQNVDIVGNSVHDNDGYGIAAYGLYIWVNENTVYSNGNGGAVFGGINYIVQYGSCNNNNVYLNDSYGIDAGCASNCEIKGNTVRFNCQAVDTCGVTLEACSLVSFQGNTVHNNGSTSCAQIIAWRHGGDGSGNWFPNQISQLHIKGNIIVCGGSRLGVKVRDGADDVYIEDNHFFGTTNANFIDFVGDVGRVSGNKFPAGNTVTLTPNGSAILPVPDGQELAHVSSTTAIQGIQYTSQVAVGAGIAWVDLNAGGSGYVAATTTVSFSGGGGSGAAGTAIVYNGQIIGVRMTSFGSGYTSAPTVSFADTGGGMGAAGAAQFKVPLQNERALEIQFAAATTIKRSGTAGPVVNSPAAADITIAVDNFVRLIARFSAWYLAGKNF